LPAQASTALAAEQCLGPGPDIPAGTALKKAVEAMTGRCERRLIAESLARNGGNKSKTARELVITRKTLATKMAKHGL